MRSRWTAVALLAIACSWGSDRSEEPYARHVNEVLRAFEKAYEATYVACTRGPTECAVAANDGVNAAREARAKLATATPPAKLRDAHGNLLRALDHLAQAYQEIADTYWNRSDLYGAYMRSVRAMEQSIREVGTAGLAIGFKGDSRIWAKR